MLYDESHFNGYGDSESVYGRLARLANGGEQIMLSRLFALFVRIWLYSFCGTSAPFQNANCAVDKITQTSENWQLRAHKTNNNSTASMNLPNRASDGSDTACDAFSSAPELNEDQQEVSRILRELRHDPSMLGCNSLGRDGIMRSLTADRDVLDAAPFSPKHIKTFLDRMPYDSKAEEEYRGVDGMQVLHQQWFHPDKSILPPPLTQEQKEGAMKLMEGHKEVFRVRKEKIAEGEDYSTCPVVVRSNHDLSLKPAEKKLQG